MATLIAVPTTDAGNAVKGSVDDVGRRECDLTGIRGGFGPLIGEFPVFSPYEELEYLADFLPEEGEMVLLTRQSGELVCKPWSNADLRDGIDDSELYGFLVQANERLHTAGAFPLWVGLMGILWLAILLHGVIGLDWTYWYLTPGVSVPLLFAVVHWIRHRQQKLFVRGILPPLRRELSKRRIPYFSLLSGVRQHGELRSLLDELVRWSPTGE